MSRFNLPRVEWAEDTRLTSQARAATQAPRVPWAKAMQSMVWRNGEHVALIGPTGQGKTTLAQAILPKHKYVAVFATKPRDESMDRLISEGYIKLDRWKTLDADRYPKRVLWPPANRLDSAKLQKVVFHEAFELIFNEGYWTVFVDETYWFQNKLGLSEDIKTYLLQARSLHISLVAAMQRPAWVPRELYTSATHLFFWRSNDRTDLDSIGGIGYLNSDLIRELVANLDRYQFLYINSRTGDMLRSRAPKPMEPPKKKKGLR
jgi:energy-coupling factor transporter ATP-binding protein EcfA2